MNITIMGKSAMGIITMTGKSVMSTTMMERKAMNITIMTGKSVTTTITTTMDAAAMTMDTIMRMRYSQAGAWRQLFR